MEKMEKMEKTSGTEKTDVEKLRAFVDDNYYKVRSCEYYKLSLKECSSLKGRFFQYFVFGESLDCTQWEEDLKNCEKNETKENLEALASIIRHENQRKIKRLQANLENDVWKRRSKPPENWTAELPDWLKEASEGSFAEDNSQSCVIF